MNHPFISSQIDALSCAKCHRNEQCHSDNAQCESCNNVGKCDLLGTILMCQACLRKEYELAVKNAKEHSESWEKDKINTAITNPIGSILHSIKTDQSIQVSSDYFNAEVTSLSELKLALENSVDASQIDFELAKLIQQRFNHFKQVLFDISDASRNLQSRQRAQYQALNDLASKLSAAQREELKLKDISYNAASAPVKSDSKPRGPRLTAEEKMAVNLFNARLSKAATKLVEDGTCKDLEEGIKIAKNRGLGISMDSAREQIRKAFGAK